MKIGKLKAGLRSEDNPYGGRYRRSLNSLHALCQLRLKVLPPSAMPRSWNGRLPSLVLLKSDTNVKHCEAQNLSDFRSVPPAWSTFTSMAGKPLEGSTTRCCAIEFPQICGRRSELGHSQQINHNAYNGFEMV